MRRTPVSDTSFLSTPSARRATGGKALCKRHLCISIHALREEGDQAAAPDFVGRRHFYPRPPRGGRQGRESPPASLYTFLSTPSARRATYPHRRRNSHDAISIHALREEGDDFPYLRFLHASHFYPRPPRGGRLVEYMKAVRHCIISIHALREEGDHIIYRVYGS